MSAGRCRSFRPVSVGALQRWGASQTVRCLAMKKLFALAITIMSFAVSNSAASMLGYQTLELDFGNPGISKIVRWSNKNMVGVESGGLGFDGESNQVVDVSLETTEPYAIGYSWRPAQSAQFDIEITPPLKPITLPNGETSVPFTGQFYVRYSPDAKHWSSWQVLAGVIGVGKESKWTFKGQVGVPQKERESYQNFLSSYSKMDVPWTSDEEAAVKWILKKEPDFFANQIPFVGYLQFLFENQLFGGQRIQKIKIGIGYGISGLATIPKDKKVQEGRDNMPWRFRVE